MKMGASKRWLEEMAQERAEKQELLLEAPKLIEESNRLIGHLREELERSSETIDELRRELQTSNSWKAKWVDYLIGGSVGALIGLLF
jgi:chromosome segregation ATPase